MNPSSGFRVLVVLAFALIPSIRLARAQPAGDSLLRPVPVRAFDQAVGLAATATAVFVVDAGAGTVVRLNLPTTGGQADVYSGSGGSEGRLQSPRDVDPTNGLTILVVDQDRGRVLRLSRDLTMIDALPIAGPNGLELRPTHVASIDDRTIALLDGTTASVFRWSYDRGIDTRFGTTVTVDAAAMPTDLAADARSVYVADRASGCVYVYDTMGSFIRRIACEPGSAILAVNISDGRLWVTREYPLRSAPGTAIESWQPDGNLAARYLAPRDLDVRSAVGAGKRVWLLTPSHLYVSQDSSDLKSEN